MSRDAAVSEVGNGPGQFLGFYVINRMRTILSPVIKLGLRHPRKKEEMPVDV